MNNTGQESEEKQRIQKLHHYGILDTPEEEDFNDIVELASYICKTPISLISLIDENRQWFKARKGVQVKETSRKIAFCDYAIRGQQLFEVEDTHKDHRFSSNPLVTGEPNIRAYAGYPLTTSDGYNLGTLCVLDKKPNKLNAAQVNALKVLSKRVVSELELRNRVKQLDKINTFKDKLLSILGHDIRSPLNSINSVIKMIDQDMLNEEELKKFRRLLTEEVHSTLNLLDNILYWSTLYMEGKELSFKKFDIDPIVQDTIAVLNLNAAKKQLTINVNTNHEEIHGDPEMIKLIIRNIYSNAIKYSLEKGSITINTYSEESYVALSIADTGIGMKPEQVERLLSKKGGVSAIGTSDEKGAGIGMLLAQEFLEANHGDMKVASEFEKGTTITIRLPAG